jgi:hypothetical protein
LARGTELDDEDADRWLLPYPDGPGREDAERPTLRDDPPGGAGAGREGVMLEMLYDIVGDLWKRYVIVRSAVTQWQATESQVQRYRSEVEQAETLMI